MADVTSTKNPWGMLDAKEKMAFIAILGVFILFIIMFALRGSDRRFIERMLQEQHEAESVACRIILGQGQQVTTQGGPCLDDDVLRHYDPWATCERLKSYNPANTCGVISERMPVGVAVSPDELPAESPVEP